MSAPHPAARTAAATPLRRGPERPAAPVRHVHLGLGNFFRAHQAWYTHRAPDAADWGIAAFTGRSPALADALAAQDGLFTLDTRGSGGDTFEVVGSISAAHPATDHAAWLAYLADPAVVIVTLTVTEAGYLRGPDGGLALDDPRAAADLLALTDDATATVSTTPFRLAAGLAARRTSGAGPITVVPCDNLPENGAVARRVVLDAARALDPALADWVDEHVSFVTTMVDRITPQPTDDDLAVVRVATGVDDLAPVVTEPFSEWVLSGEFVAGRPRWEDAGATFTDDIVPFEARKLTLLNGAHSMLAYGGLLRGHVTVADAIADATCRHWVEQWWDEAVPHLTLPAADLATYRAALLERFANPGIRHRLDQIATDGSQKLPVRLLPTVHAERAAGRVPHGAARILAAWVAYLRRDRDAVRDVRADELRPLAGGDDPRTAVSRVLAALAPALAQDRAILDAVEAALGELTAAPGPA